AHWQTLERKPQGLSRRLHSISRQGHARVGGAPQDGGSREARNGLLQQFDPLAVEVFIEEAQPRDVGARSGEARHRPDSYGRARQEHADPRDFRRLLRSSNGWRGEEGERKSQQGKMQYPPRGNSYGGWLPWQLCTADDLSAGPSSPPLRARSRLQHLAISSRT